MNKQQNIHRLFLRSLLLLLGLALFQSCSALKKAGIGKKEDALDSAPALIAAIQSQSLEADWVNAKAKVSFDGGGMSVSGTATIRLKRDSLLWVSVRKLGFEVARALVTTDSVYVLNRLLNEYGIFGLDYLEETYSLPGEFGMVQSIVLGEPYFLNPKEAELTMEEDRFQLIDTSPAGQITYEIESKDFKLLNLNYLSRDRGQELKLDLEEYDLIEGKQLFSYFRQLNMVDASIGITEMTVKFSQIELDTPKDVAFRIPSRYTKMGE